MTRMLAQFWDGKEGRAEATASGSGDGGGGSPHLYPGLQEDLQHRRSAWRRKESAACCLGELASLWRVSQLRLHLPQQRLQRRFHVRGRSRSSSQARWTPIAPLP